MPKLHLKRTPEEEAVRRLRKREKKEAKGKRGRRHCNDSEYCDSSHTRKRYRRTEDPSDPMKEKKWASSDEDEEQYGPRPTRCSTRTRHPFRPDEPDQDELRFRAKLFDAFADDERLDSLEAKLNDFAHVPDRWRTGSSSKARLNVVEDDEWLKLDPQTMDEEEYTEWIRVGMYRKTHANEYAEEQRKKAAQAAQRAKEKARRDETARLAQAAEAEQKAMKRERDARRLACAREAYDAKWQIMQSGINTEDGAVGFGDIPWPIVDAHKHRAEAVTVENLTVDAISAFLLRGGNAEEDKKVLRETILRFHPDKFEGRFMRTVREPESEAVRDGIGRVIRALNRLMAK